MNHEAPQTVGLLTPLTPCAAGMGKILFFRCLHVACEFVSCLYPPYECPPGGRIAPEGRRVPTGDKIFITCVNYGPDLKYSWVSPPDLNYQNFCTCQRLEFHAF